MRCAATSRSWIRRTSVASSRSAVLLVAALILGGPAAAQERAVLTGRIVRPAPGDTVAAAGVRVVLHRVGQETQGPLDSTRTGTDGRFRFATRRDTAAVFLVSARYGGIEFFSQPVTFRDSAPPGPLTLLVSDTSSTAPVTVGGRYLVVGAPDADRRRTAVDLIVLRNQGHLTRVARDSLTPTWRAVLPRALGHRVAESGSEISSSAVQFRNDTILVFAPLSPGEKQLLLEHAIPADWPDWAVPLGDGAAQLQVVSEEAGVRVDGSGLAAAESQVVDGRPLLRWVGQGNPGMRLTVTFPAEGASEHQLVIALVAATLLALILFAWLGLRRRPGRGSVAAVLAALSATSACGAPGGAAVLRIVDDAGDTVALARPAERVVSLIPAATELLFAIGAGNTLVGRTDWCDHPPAATAVRSLGAGLEPNIEAVLGARPDLVMLYPSPQTVVAAARLRSLGIPAMQWRTDRLEDLTRGARQVGLLTGHVDESRAAVARLDSALAAATRSRTTRPRVLIIAWDQPPIAIGRASFLHELV
ncbi:MAG TPA: helical backbone metal receptor, partial [Gemmatimonadales bacterium]